jgi:hypothetical protein
VHGGVVDLIGALGQLNSHIELDRALRNSFGDFIEQEIGTLRGSGPGIQIFIAITSATLPFGFSTCSSEDKDAATRRLGH